MKKTSLLTLFIFMLFSTEISIVYAMDLNVESREQAMQLVKQQYQGKVLKVQPSKTQQGEGYQIKLLSKKGVIFYLYVDAQTGNVSKK